MPHHSAYLDLPLRSLDEVLRLRAGRIASPTGNLAGELIGPPPAPDERAPA